MGEYDQAVIKKPQVLEYADEVDLIHPTTWGEVYRRLERHRLRAWTTIAFAIFAGFATLIFIINDAILLAVFSTAFGAWFFRNYFSASVDYTSTWGGRRCLIPNLKVKQ